MPIAAVEALSRVNMRRAVAVCPHGLSSQSGSHAKKANKGKVTAAQNISVAKSYFTTLTDDHCSLSASTEAPAKSLLV